MEGEHGYLLDSWLCLPQFLTACHLASGRQNHIVVSEWINKGAYVHIWGYIILIEPIEGRVNISCFGLCNIPSHFW